MPPAVQRCVRATLVSVTLLFLAGELAGQSLPPAPGANASSPAKQITVLIRFDDVSRNSSTSLESKIIQILRAHHVRANFAVIPFVPARSHQDSSVRDLLPLSPEKVNLLRQAMADGTVEVTLHGYTHQSLPHRSPNVASEFAGLPFQAQVELIEKGKRLLESLLGTRIDSFTPPWNNYDVNTLRAAEKNGLRIFSGAIDGPGLVTSRLLMIPATIHFPEVRQALAAARASRDPRPVVGLLFHAFDFREMDARRGQYTSEDFEVLISWLASQPDVGFRTMGELASDAGAFDASRFLANEALLRVCGELAPHFICSSDTVGNGYVYMSAGFVRSERLKYTVLVVSFYVVAFVIVVFCARRLANVWILPETLRRVAQYSAFLMILLVTAYAYRDSRVYYRGLLAIVATSALWLGLWRIQVPEWARAIGSSRRTLSEPPMPERAGGNESL